MIKKRLEYMLNYDKDVTLTEKGVINRNKIRPLIYKILKMSNKLKLIIEKNEFNKSDRLVIYIASHAFKDDVLNTVVTIKDDAQIVFGNIDLFFNTLDGLFLWIYGCQLVDRYDKKSREAMKEKMNKILELGNNIIIFSEATWNLSPNLPIQNLHWGYYDIAKKHNALIVPVITNKVGNKCYSRMLKGIEIDDFNKDDISLMTKKIVNYFNKAVDLITISTDNLNNLKKELNNLQPIVNSLTNNDNIKFRLHFIKNKIYKIIDDMSTEKNKSSNQTELLILKEILSYLSRIINIEKEVFTIKIRDIMATEKFDMYAKHPDNSYEKKSKDKYEAWNKYLSDTIKATPYFYFEPEQTTICKDKLIKDEQEVMPWLYDEKKMVLKK